MIPRVSKLRTTWVKWSILPNSIEISKAGAADTLGHTWAYDPGVSLQEGKPDTRRTFTVLEARDEVVLENFSSLRNLESAYK